MSSKIKVASVFALFSATLASCSGAHQELRRVSYEKEVEKCAELVPIITTFGEKQRVKVEGATEDELYSFSLFAKGTVTTGIDLNIIPQEEDMYAWAKLKQVQKRIYNETTVKELNPEIKTIALTYKNRAKYSVIRREEDVRMQKNEIM